MNAAIAQHLNIAEQAIAKVEEWAHVLFVRFTSGRPQFVSKKVVKMESPKLNCSEAAEKVAEICSNKYGFGQCTVWSKKENECRVYLGKNGYVEIKDTVDLYYLKSYKKEVAQLLGDLVGCELRTGETLTTADVSQKCWRDEDGNPVNEIAHPAEAAYFD